MHISSWAAYDEAASWAAMTLQDNPDFQGGLRIDAASNAMAGRLEQAHKGNGSAAATQSRGYVFPPSRT